MGSTSVASDGVGASIGAEELGCDGTTGGYEGVLERWKWSPWARVVAAKLEVLAKKNRSSFRKWSLTIHGLD